jgi:hypothetical protein
MCERYSSTIEGTVKSLNLGMVMKYRDVLKNKDHLQLSMQPISNGTDFWFCQVT